MEHVSTSYSDTSGPEVMEKGAKSAKPQSKKSKKTSKSSPGGNQKLVEYSDVSSNELSAPEAGELPSDGLSIVSDDEISTIDATSTNNNNNNNSIYEPIDDDDEELEKLMDADAFSDSFDEASKRKKKTKKKRRKLKKSKKRKKQRRSSEESIEEISDDEALLDSADGDKTSKRPAVGGTPPLDQISFTPKNKFNSYTPISPGTSPILNASPESLSDAPPGTTNPSSKRNSYRSPHTPPLPKKLADEISRNHGGATAGRHSSISSSASQKASTKKRHPSPERERTNSYRSKRSRDNSPYYESRRYREKDRERERERERERASSPYSSRNFRNRRRRSR